jgi:YARHG domain/TIR domain
MTMIMVSYRRVDQDTAGRIADHLIDKYGEKSVFFDVNSIRTGANFVDRIAKAIAASDIVIAVIGPHWIGKAADGTPARLADPADSVRFEIETALKHNKTILPLLVNGATMPQEAELPESLRFLHFCNAARVDSGQDFRMHMTRLIGTINEVLRESGQSPLREISPVRRYWKYAAGAAVAALALALWLVGPTLEHTPAKSGGGRDSTTVGLTPPAVPPSVVQRAKAHDGFLFPDSDRRFLAEADLKDMSAIELRIARNEIFARRGRFFKDQVLANYFSQFSWYQPSAVEVPLSNLETTNVATIQSMEHDK